MSYVVIGTCTKCGAPIYTQSPWMAITPPPSFYSCPCWGPVKEGTTFYKITAISQREENNTKRNGWPEK